MVKGPRGGPRPFARDEKAVTVIIGTEMSIPEHGQGRVGMSSEFEHKLSKYGDTSLQIRDALYDDREYIGNDALGVLEVTVGTGKEEVSTDTVEGIEDTCKNVVSSMGFSITGTKTVIH